MTALDVTSCSYCGGPFRFGTNMVGTDKRVNTTYFLCGAACQMIATNIVGRVLRPGKQGSRGYFLHELRRAGLADQEAS